MIKGRSVTAAQKRFHCQMASLGCVACKKMRIFTPHVSIHHIDGRTKPWAHWLVLPLCGPHHQDMGALGVFAVHPYKARFESEYGTQKELFAECIGQLDNPPAEALALIASPAAKLAGMKKAAFEAA